MSEKINRDKLNKANALINMHLCNFISDKFLKDPKNRNGVEISQNSYAQLVGLSSSTLTKIKSSTGYDIPFSTLYNICRHEKYSIKTLFKEFEEKYGINIPE
ncbi:helix-turn-helix domain-containing protein [Formosa algae]|uniref:helix-turn-helix domain-containing protein n=1 Tax=Formosa algae TaxID=225843 RepID=UPI000CCF2452|nr:transcriptional regulator [Formosa algae]PNW27290.1 hypothetical protein BKP44_13640 [Formosa algae]